jgi:hypothetical protein
MPIDAVEQEEYSNISDEHWRGFWRQLCRMINLHPYHSFRTKVIVAYFKVLDVSSNVSSTGCPLA